MPIKQIPRPGNKKQELLARKQTILNNLNYYEKRIRDESSSNASKVLFEDSSDSDSDLPFHINTGPSISELRDTEEMLHVTLNATCELSCLEVLQSEVHFVTQEPDIQHGAPVTKPGVWREVTAECRIGTVHFSITFHEHKAAGQFGSKSYRNLKVLPVKKFHEVELSKSVFPHVKTPSNAVEVLRSYSAAHRSRRSTLSRLADKYAGSLFMTPMTEGGFKLKCTSLLELSWILENNKSPLAPFHHKMIFDLEYMDESFIKVIRQAHKQLSDPSIDTDERTLLLAMIFNTCLEAEGAAQESMESEVETVKKVDKRRITLDTEETAPKNTKNNRHNENNDNNIIQEDDANFDNDGNDQGNDRNNEKDDKHIMAPPKSLPKKMKPKGKENMVQNTKTAKRAIVEENNISAKKPKFDKNNTNTKNVKESDQNKVSNNKDDKEAIDKIAKTQNVKNKTSKTETNAQKEASKASEKVKPVKSKSKETIEVIKTGNIQNDNNDIQKKNNTKVQQIAKKHVNQETESQKEADNKITKASDKVKPVKSKSKETIENTKTGDSDKVSNEIQNKINTKKVQEIAKKQTEPQKESVKEIGKSTEKVKVIKSKSKKITEVAKSGVNLNDKAKETQKKDNVRKVLENPEKQTNKDMLQNVEKDKKIVNAKNIDKAGTSENVAQSKNEIGGKAIIKKVATSKNLIKNANDGKNDQKSTKVKEKNSSENVGKKINQVNAKPKNEIASKPKTQVKDKGISNNKKDSENVKVTNDEIHKNALSDDQKELTPFDRKKIISSTPKSVKSSANLRQSGNIIQGKISSDNKNKENLATTKNAITKTVANPKISAKKTSKMVIKNLSHKNPPSKNLVPKIITGNLKSIKPTNVGKEIKFGDSSKDSTGSKISKIPKKLGIPEKLRRNSLRISPRRLPSTFKSTSDSNVKQKFNQITNIPRLAKKT